MSRCTQGGGGGRRRYTSTEGAVGYYLSLVSQLCSTPAVDYERIAARVDGGSREVRSEPRGLDDYMALKALLAQLCGEVEPRKWRLWEMQRLNLMSSRDAASLNNKDHVASGGAKLECISHTTAQAWRVELDARCEQLLAACGLLRIGYGEDR